MAKKEKNQAKPSCPYFDKEECHIDPKNKRHKSSCKYSKDSCLFEKEPEEVPSWLQKNYPFLIGGLVGLILLILSIWVICNSGWVTIVQGLGTAVLASSILGGLIDTPGKLKDYENSLTSALTSFNYLKRLGEAELTDLRGKTTHLLHKKDVPNMPRGLIKLDEQICKQLKLPYYKWYRQFVKCSFTTGDRKFIEKHHVIKYMILNPYPKNQPKAVDIGFNTHIITNDISKINDDFKLSVFKVIIDGNKEYDLLKLSNDIGIAAVPLPTNSPHNYNYKVFFYQNEKDPIDLKNKTPTDESIKINCDRDEASDFIKLLFCDNLYAEIQYTIKVPVDDNFYVKLLRYPVKYFRLDYDFDDEKVILNGQLIGTLIDQSKISTDISNNSRHISIETFDYLLPKNGAVIVTNLRNTNKI